MSGKSCEFYHRDVSSFKWWNWLVEDYGRNVLECFCAKVKFFGFSNVLVEHSYQEGLVTVAKLMVWYSLLIMYVAY